MCKKRNVTSLEDDIMRHDEEFPNEVNMCESSVDRHVTLCIHVVPLFSLSLRWLSSTDHDVCLFSEQGVPMKTVEGLEMPSLLSKQTE